MATDLCPANKKKVLILTTHPAAKGGVTNYFNVFEKYFSSDTIDIDFFFVGKKVYNPSPAFMLYYSVTDVVKLLWRMRRYDLVHLNPTLGHKAVVRDGTYHILAKRLFRKKTMVFFHGWFPETEQAIENGYVKLFRFAFNFDCAIVLGTVIKKTLLRWGYPEGRIVLETTPFEAAPIKRTAGTQKAGRTTIVFLGRLEKAKGVLEAVQTVEIIQKTHPSVVLNLIGDGNYRQVLEGYVAQKGLRDCVVFSGNVEGEDKYTALAGAHILILPSYTEGMPTAVVEAMAAGLPVVASSVGGLPDIVHNNENGFLIESFDPASFARAVIRLIDDPELYAAISENNRKKAFQRCEAATVVRRIETEYLRLLT